MIMVEVYVQLILRGLKTLDDINDPVMREKVEARLKELGYTF